MARTALWEHWRSLAFGLLLAAGTVAVYWPVTGFDFVNFDDPFYVTENPEVQPGLTRAGLDWALRATQAANWHPVTWVSHMLDCQLYGPRAGGHHLTSVLLHAANSWLLFGLLLRLTGKCGRSFLIAALFAWHPLRVESVAWIAERKDVLSAFFFLLTLWAYVKYAGSKVQSPTSFVKSTTVVNKSKAAGEVSRVEGRGTGWKSEVRKPKSETNPKSQTRNPKSEVQGSRFNVQGSRFPLALLHPPSAIYYLLALFLFALGLMSKPMLVTLPFVLLLLDYWPLQRVSSGGCRVAAAPVRSSIFVPLLLEKLPFLALSAASCAITLWAQGLGGAIAKISDLPLKLRFANALLSYWRYIWKTVWPANLAVFYPYYQKELTGLVWLAGGLLVVVSAAVLWFRKFPYLPVGWSWYLGSLVPVIGLVQVGAQALADRYSYLPSIGLFILGVFGLNELAARFRQCRSALIGLATLAVAGCLGATRQQLGHWRNNEALYRHAIDVTHANFVACNNLGTALEAQGRKDEAARWYREALRWKPDYADAHCNLASVYIALERVPEAITEYETALKINPRLARAHYLLANQLLADGDAAGASDHYQTALVLKPDYAEAHYQMAVVLQARDEVAEASRHYGEALRLKPDWIQALNNFSWLLATHPKARFRDGNQALALASRGVALTHTNDARLLDTLAGALAELGRFSEAASAARSAARLARAAGLTQLEPEIEAHLQSYERGRPFREASAPGTKPAAKH
jgi:tetratricopeptide (TPR) repeat protein